MAIMIAAPIVVRLSERLGLETGARFWAYASFSWMGMLFLFLVLAVTVDLGRFAFWATEKILRRKLPRTTVSPGRLLAIQALLVAAVFGYGTFEAADIRLEQIEIASPKIAKNTGRLRIAQISDVHLGLIVRKERLKSIFARIREARPDILVSTGDLVDGQLNHFVKEAGLLAALKPPLGKFAITGNHEFYAGLQEAGINLVGVDDPAVSAFAQEPAESERDLLAAQAKENFTLLLKHRPEIDPASLGLFDLQLSGHTHKGQIFPFNLITWFFYPQRSGQLTSLKSGFFYLSRGTGTWGPPIRFLAPPEVTIIDLVPAK
jgi:predicted MPP superfamily phosphohydrolase